MTSIKVKQSFYIILGLVLQLVFFLLVTWVVTLILMFSYDILFGAGSVSRMEVGGLAFLFLSGIFSFFLSVLVAATFVNKRIDGLYQSKICPENFFHKYRFFCLIGLYLIVFPLVYLVLTFASFLTSGVWYW
ncbi:MAG: hypothetical protein ISS87_02090 [Candidatus Pacebacteria bacterium]|nr:hypothetical protein [Candidatus Paceibacterota bacterium]